MLTGSQLTELERSLRGTTALTVYLDGAAAGPGARAARRRRLADELDVVRRALRGAEHVEREAFERAVAHLEQRLDAIGEEPSSRGWVGVATPDGVRHAEALPVAVPVLVAWGDGVRIAPYLRAVEQHRPMAVAVVDSRKARVYALREGRLETHGTLHAHAHVDPETHMGEPPRAGFHTGTRGATGKDAADRALLMGRDRMLHELAERLAEAAGSDGGILVGGIPEVAMAALEHLPEDVRGRAQAVAGLDVHATEAQVTERAESAVTELRRATAEASVREVLDQYAAGGTAAIRRDGVLEALREAAVDRLFLSERFLHDDPVAAELAVRTAFDQGARVTYVDGPAAERCDAEAGGIAARLRFVPTRGQAPLAASPP